MRVPIGRIGRALAGAVALAALPAMVSAAIYMNVSGDRDPVGGMVHFGWIKVSSVDFRSHGGAAASREAIVRMPTSSASPKLVRAAETNAVLNRVTIEWALGDLASRRVVLHEVVVTSTAVRGPNETFVLVYRTMETDAVPGIARPDPAAPPNTQRMEPPSPR